jgi:SCY1-like protein 2
VEESKTAIVFTTERIVCSLADIVNHFQGIEGGFSSHEDFFEDYGAVSEMEISKGLLSLAEGLQYLHNVQRKLHLNITPESVVISGNGQWKLCGFGFNLTFIQGDQQRLASPYFLKASPISHGVRLEPDLRYSGPECTDGGFNPPGIRYLTPASDLFSLGLLAYEMYRYNLKDIPERNSHRCVLTLTNNDVLQHHFALDALKALDFSFLPSGVSQLVIGLLQLNVMVRLTTADIINNQYFVSGSLAVLNMIEHMHSRDVGTQSSQLISLQGQLGSFSSRILYLNVLPSICKLCLVNSALWVYAMPLHVFISQQVSKERFKQYAGPTMANGLAVTTPTETQQAFLNNIQFIAGMFDREYFQANIVVLFCNALEKQNIFLQVLTAFICLLFVLCY